jgi:hypothetical protein
MKRKIVIATGFVLAILVGVGIFIFTTLDDSTEASVGDVVGEFRSTAKPDAPARDGLPKQGVYRYAVTGKERIKSTITINRDLPAAAPSLVRHTDGGFEVETRFSDQHVELARYSVEPEGAFVTFAVTTIKAGPIKTVRERSWSPKLLRMPSAATAKSAPTWGGDFTAGDLKLKVTSRMLAPETIDVGGTPVPVQVAESVQAITGEYTGDRTETFWFSPTLGVIVRYKITSSITGPTDLDFEADQTLLSTVPEV